MNKIHLKHGISYLSPLVSISCTWDLHGDTSVFSDCVMQLQGLSTLRICRIMAKITKTGNMHTSQHLHKHWCASQVLIGIYAYCPNHCHRWSINYSHCHSLPWGQLWMCNRVSHASQREINSYCFFSCYTSAGKENAPSLRLFKVVLCWHLFYQNHLIPFHSFILSEHQLCKTELLKGSHSKFLGGATVAGMTSKTMCSVLVIRVNWKHYSFY